VTPSPLVEPAVDQRAPAGQFRSLPFGALVEDEASFRGYPIPTRLRVGWYIGTEVFEQDGEFFRVIVDDASYR
jgi:hypothetical protein